MSKKVYEVSGVEDVREAYEIEEHLKGFRAIDTAFVNVVEDTVLVKWDNSLLSEERIIRELDALGCTVLDGKKGTLAKLLGRLH